jgi:hypothetical protein
VWAACKKVSLEECEIAAFLRLRGQEASSSSSSSSSSGAGPMEDNEEAWEKLGGVSPRRRSSAALYSSGGGGGLHRLNKEGLNNHLSCFPEMLSIVDWTSSDEVLKGKSSQNKVLNNSSVSSLTQHQLTDIFSKIDSGGDGGLDILDLKIWSRMLPIGREERLFVRDVMKVASTVSRDGLLRAASLNDLTKLCFENGLDGSLLSKELELQLLLLNVILGHNRFKTFADFSAPQYEKQYHTDVELSFRLLSKIALCRYSHSLRLGLSSQIEKRKSEGLHVARRLSSRFTSKRPATHL